MSPENLFAGAIIGDCSVEMCIMHIDPRGAMHPIWSKQIPVKTPMSVTPSITDITKALVSAWNVRREPYLIHYKRFFLCLPAWICSSSTDTRQINIPDKSEFGINRTSEITMQDVRRLKTLISSEAVPENHLVVDLIPHRYILETTRRVMDPCGNISKTLGLDSFVTYSETGFTKAILDCLDEQGIEVDVMMSPFTAHTGILSPEEKEAGTVVIDVGRRYTACSFFEEGILRHSALLDTGSDNILADIADSLNLSMHEAESVVDQQQELIKRSDTNNKIHSLPLFAWGASHPATRRLGSIAALSAQNLFNDISSCIKSASLEMMIKIDSAVIVGDDQLTVQVLRDICQDLVDIPCRTAKPSSPVSLDSACADCHIRTTGFMKHAMLFQRRFQHYLERYNESIPDKIIRNLTVKAAHFCTWSLKRIKEMGQKLPEKARLPNILPESSSGRIRSISLPHTRHSIPLS